MRAVRFNISSSNLPGIGKFGIEGSNDEGVAADFYFSVSIQGTTVVPEQIIAGGVLDTLPYTNYDIDIPEDTSTGLYMSGVYTINIISKQPGTSTVISTYTEQFGFNPYLNRPEKVAVSSKIDCNRGYFILKDDTVYRATSFQSVVRQWTITPPSYQGVSGAPVTGTDDFVKIFFPYVNTTYDYLLESYIVYVLVSGVDIDVTETHTLTIESTYKVDCDVNLAEIKQCVYDTLASIEASACRVGGFDKIDASVKDKYLKLNQYLNGWNFADAINDWDSRKAYYLKISDLLGCGCETDDTVKPFVLPDGSNPVETAWAEVVTATQNGFVNSPTSPLHWRVSPDNRLQIFGKIQIPAGLSDAVPHIITTGFLPATLVDSIPENRTPVNSTAGDVEGSIYMESSTDLLFRTKSGGSTLTFAYVNIDIPLEL